MRSKAAQRMRGCGRDKRSGIRTRKPYTAPRGEILGLVYELALGTSPGIGDSLDPADLQAGGVPQPPPPPRR